MENFHSVNIKLKKNLVKDSRDLKDKELLVLCYLFFNTTCKHNVYTTINNMCEEIKLSTSSHRENNNQNSIKETIQSLINKDVVELLNCDDISSVTNDKLIKLHFKDYDSFIDYTSQYVSLSLEEFDKILSCGKDISKVLNIYCYIKSYICMDQYCLKICYPSIKNMFNTFNCSRNTIKPILDILEENKLLYIYHFEVGELKENKYDIEYIFSLEKYTRKEIKDYFTL